ncbi:MAG: hypothetical protein AAFN10_00815 [Bacteroidota bacterium]
MKKSFLLALTLFAIGATACINNLDWVLPRAEGTWDVDRYIATTEIAGDTVADITYDNAGTFVFEKDGTGTADLSVPGNTQTNQAILWSWDKEAAVLTIDWQDGDDPWEFEVIEQDLERLFLRRTTVNVILGIENRNYREMELLRE